MRQTFQAEQWLPYSVESVFAFFANPKNLPPLMPSWQKARIESASLVTPPPALGSAFGGTAAGQGTRMTISFLPFPLSPIRVQWEAQIDEFVWNDHFCDTQLRGPFAFWHHCHHVSAQTRNDMPGTLVRDHLQYAIRFGKLGDLANFVAVRHQIQKIFAFRQQRTEELLPRYADSGGNGTDV